MEEVAKGVHRATPRALLRGVALCGWTAGVLGASSLKVATQRLQPGHRHPEDTDWNKTTRVWAQGNLHILGVRALLHGPTHDTRSTPTLVVANHRSPLDIVLLLQQFGGHFVSRADLKDWPLLGKAAQRVGTVFVDREDHNSGARAIFTIRSLLRQGQTVLVFPEGTTHAGDEVHPFRSGAFAAARDANATIIPVGIAYPEGTEFVEHSFVDYALRVTQRPRLEVSMQIGNAIPSQPKKSASLTNTPSVKEFADQIRQQVQQLTHQARSHLT